MTSNRTQKMAQLNDLCREAMGVAGRVFQTEGIAALAPADQAAIRERVGTFDAFTSDNDPYGERDFGSFEHNGIKVFWKIDYYDRAMELASENPADPAQTTRVLTIMLAVDLVKLLGGWLVGLFGSKPRSCSFATSFSS